MKITTWNVNGIRAAIQKGTIAWVTGHQPDILCLQEVKARPDQLIDAPTILDDAVAYWHPAEKAGYSGVATFTRSLPDSVQIGLGDSRFDSEGRAILARYPNFSLYNIYFPNGQRGHDRVSYKLDFYAHLLNACDAQHAAGEKIIITGDFNTAHREIDLANPRQNAKTSGFLPEERVWLDYYLEHGFVDAYRELYPERVQYTWWTYISNARSRNIGWRLDFFLVSRALLDSVVDVIVHDDVPGSDHCPVTLVLKE